MWRPDVSHTRGLEIDSLLLTDLLAGQVSNFTAATFVEMADFSKSILHNSNFTDVHFLAGCDFSEATLAGDTTFNGARFDGTSRFYLAAFGAHSNFSHCTFSGHATFMQAHFDGSTNWKWSKFNSSVSFHGASFSNTALFRLVEFKASATFKAAHFCNDVSFDQSRSNEIVDLTECAIEGAFSCQAHINDGEAESLELDFSEAHLEGRDVLISGPIRLSDIHLKHPLRVVAGVPSAGARLLSLARAHLDEPLLIGDGVSVRDCVMAHAVGLKHFQIAGEAPDWHRFRRRQVLADELILRRVEGQAIPSDVAIGSRSVESAYRQLRVALEDAKAAPAAADFFYGEMEMRRATARSTFERAFLLIYKIASGYGLRASRALISWACVLLAVSALFYAHPDWFFGDVLVSKGAGELKFDSFVAVTALVLRSSMTFFAPLLDGLTPAGIYTLTVVRFVEPALLALSVLAIRSRVQR